MLIIKDSHRWLASSAIGLGQLRTRAATSAVGYDWVQAGTPLSMTSAVPMLHAHGYQ